MSEQSRTPSSGSLAHRRTRALLAGGLVLGLGAAGTLAAWTDSEFAFGVFNAGQFNVQGNAATSNTTLPTGWGDHFTADGAALTFSTGVSTMQPGTTYYAPFTVRVDPTKNAYDASTVLNQSTSTGNAILEAKLSWGARIVADPNSCSFNGYSGSTTTLAATGTAMDHAVPSNAFTLAKTSTPVTVCFAVTLAAQTAGSNPNLPEWAFGPDPVTTVWQFNATSV